MSRHTVVFRKGLALLNAALVFKQLGLAVLAFLLTVMWLRIPDANFFEVFASFVAAVGILAIVTFGEASILLRLVGVNASRRQAMRAAGVILAVVVVAMFWYWFIGNSHGNDSMQASYVNSKLPRALRYLFTYSRIGATLGWFWSGLQWVGVGILLACGLAIISGLRLGRTLLRIIATPTYWIALLLAVVVGVVVTTSLVDWTPGHGLSIEMLSLILRLGISAVVDSVLFCLVLAVVAAIIRDDEAQAVAEAGTPLTSQPRTVVIP